MRMCTPPMTSAAANETGSSSPERRSCSLAMPLYRRRGEIPSRALLSSGGGVGGCAADYPAPRAVPGGASGWRRWARRVLSPAAWVAWDACAPIWEGIRNRGAHLEGGWRRLVRWHRRGRHGSCAPEPPVVRRIGIGSPRCEKPAKRLGSMDPWPVVVASSPGDQRTACTGRPPRDQRGPGRARGAARKSVGRSRAAPPASALRLPHAAHGAGFGGADAVVRSTRLVGVPVG